MTKKHTLITLAYIGISVLFLTGCGNPKAAQKPPSVMPYPTIKVATRTVTKHASYPASIEGVINAQVRAKVPGYVQDVLVDEGEVVRKGQLLFKLETASLSQDAGAAQARINVAQVEVDKLKP